MRRRKGKDVFGQLVLVLISEHSSDLSSLSNKTTSITMFEQAFVFPRGISALSTTSTTYGISMKDIIGMLTHLLYK